MQIKPQMSEVTPCQVLLTTKFRRQPPEMTGVKARKAFETLLTNIEKEGKDPMIFIRDHLKGKHISGNHRYMIKQRFFANNEGEFNKKNYWNITITQLFIGLRSDQARY